MLTVPLLPQLGCRESFLRVVPVLPVGAVTLVEVDGYSHRGVGIRRPLLRLSRESAAVVTRLIGNLF